MREEVRVDVSEAIKTCKELYSALSPEMFNDCMTIALRDAGTREVKNQVKRRIPRFYHANARYVGRKVGKARMKSGMCCEVPIRGERGILGGMFPASGGGYAEGAASSKGKRKKKLKHNRRIQAKIVRGHNSKIPLKLKNQGGHAPFRLPKGIVLTHSARGATVRVVGRSVPQMVDRHFEDELKDPLENYIVRRLDQVITAKTKGTWGKRR